MAAERTGIRRRGRRRTPKSPFGVFLIFCIQIARRRARTKARHVWKESEETLLLRRWEPLLLRFLTSGLGQLG
ncbi:hypothetical protein ES288_D12G226500v1 [Gossypium darwinii]|uniref:Uncharacterized protein n=1 Tax=Gossypium darwinii TaxID=34276 RepID=A0A5D2ACN0_GOSDA|nr:hypothetical protein ES288_D12G226500v1 [Gossypium darwinii]